MVDNGLAAVLQHLVACVHLRAAYAACIVGKNDYIQ